MPLEQSNSRAAIGRNISREESAGRPHDQAVAIGLSTADRNGGVPHAKHDDPPANDSKGDGHWMEKLHKGHLHQALGVPEGQKIPADKMQEAMSGSRGPEVKKMAETAKTMEHENPNWHKEIHHEPSSHGRRFAESMRGSRSGPEPVPASQSGGAPPPAQAQAQGAASGGMTPPSGPSPSDGDEDDEDMGTPASSGSYLRG